MSATTRTGLAVIACWAFPILAFQSILLEPTCSANTQATTPQIQVLGSDGFRVQSSTARQHFLEIDDASFRTPLVSMPFHSSALILREPTGLSVGTPYRVRIDGLNRGTYRLDLPNSGTITYADVRRTWETHGRSQLAKYSGLIRGSADNRWVTDASWSHASSPAQDAYYVEQAIRGAINLGMVCHDNALLDELSSFFVAYSSRFQTIHQMMQQPGADTHLLAKQPNPLFRALAAVNTSAPKHPVTTLCDLCTAQFLHPASRLLRIITTLAPGERTPMMLSFARQYAPLIVRDHLLRLLDTAGTNLRAHWRSVRLGNHKYPNAVTDTDLWVIATAAEVLGANSNDPALVPLNQHEQAELRSAVEEGVSVVVSSRDEHADTTDSKGVVVGSSGYFEGDFADYADFAFAGYADSRFPSPTDAKKAAHVSWDVSHFYRFPIFLRSLWDNRKATHLQFPTASDITLVVNQLLYRVKYGGASHPLFHNFFDGTDGWFRVGYHGPHFGYPPSQQCNMRGGEGSECLSAGTLQGWGLLGAIDVRIDDLVQTFVRLASSNSPQDVSFRERYYHWGEEFAVRGDDNQRHIPYLLYFLLSDAPFSLRDCSGGAARNNPQQTHAHL